MIHTYALPLVYMGLLNLKNTDINSKTKCVFLGKSARNMFKLENLNVLRIDELKNDTSTDSLGISCSFNTPMLLQNKDHYYRLKFKNIAARVILRRYSTEIAYATHMRVQIGVQKCTVQYE